MSRMDVDFDFPAGTGRNGARITEICTGLVGQWQMGQQATATPTQTIPTIIITAPDTTISAIFVPPTPRKTNTFWGPKKGSRKARSDSDVEMTDAPPFTPPQYSPMAIDSGSGFDSPSNDIVMSSGKDITPPVSPDSPTPISRIAYRTNKVAALRQVREATSKNRKQPREVTLRELIAQNAPRKRRKCESHQSPGKENSDPDVDVFFYPFYTSPAANITAPYFTTPTPNYSVNSPKMQNITKFR
ncbi:hypothetical protein F5Y04DRAFT_284712 [Hypomontagnella monticulosa]|nr:hypothetical protein F5Y04DRAFT_284712 [Hypomontagnella monticulosa]